VIFIFKECMQLFHSSTANCSNNTDL